MVRSPAVYALASLLAGSIGGVTAALDFDGNLPTTIGYDYTYPVSYTGASGLVKITLVDRSNNNNHVFDCVCNKWLLNQLDNACTTDDNPLQITIPPRSQQGPYTGYYSLGLLADTADESTEVYSNSFHLVTHDEAPSPTSSSTSSTSTPTDPAQSTSSGTTSSSNPTDTSVGSDDRASGLSTGAKAGIGVGSAVVGLALLGGLGFWLFRMGRRSAAAKAGDDDEDAERAEALAPKEAELASDDTTQSPMAKMAEMDTPAVIHEAPDHKARLETPNNTFMAELDATGGSFVIPTSRPGSAVGDKTSNPAGATDSAMPTVVVTGSDDEKKSGTSEGSKGMDTAKDAAGSPDTVAISPVSHTSADGDAAFAAATSSPRAGSPTEVSPTDKEEPASKRAETPTRDEAGKEPHYPETPDDVGRGK